MTKGKCSSIYNDVLSKGYKVYYSTLLTLYNEHSDSVITDVLNSLLYDTELYVKVFLDVFGTLFSPSSDIVNKLCSKTSSCKDKADTSIVYGNASKFVSCVGHSGISNNTRLSILTALKDFFKGCNGAVRGNNSNTLTFMYFVVYNNLWLDALHTEQLHRDAHMLSGGYKTVELAYNYYLKHLCSCTSDFGLSNYTSWSYWSKFELYSSVMNCVCYGDYVKGVQGVDEVGMYKGCESTLNDLGIVFSTYYALCEGVNSVLTRLETAKAVPSDRDTSYICLIDVYSDMNKRCAV